MNVGILNFLGSIVVATVAILTPVTAVAGSNVSYSANDRNIMADGLVGDTLNVSSNFDKKLYVKSNSVGWVLLIMNMAVEYDISKDMSINLAVYHSPYNYFSHTNKLRTITIQPEVRYWPLEKRNFFVGAHASVAWWNYAIGGDYRYQDHDHDSPLVGAGVNAGYRTAISNNKLWNVEFSLGVGYAYVDYDIFKVGHRGALLDRKIKHFVGIDQLAVSVSYTIDLGGRK